VKERQLEIDIEEEDEGIELRKSDEISDQSDDPNSQGEEDDSSESGDDSSVSGEEEEDDINEELEERPVLDRHPQAQPVSNEELVDMIEELEMDNLDERDDDEISVEIPLWAVKPEINKQLPDYSKWHIPNSRKKAVLDQTRSEAILGKLLDSKQLPLEFKDLGPYETASWLDMHLWWEAVGLPVRALDSLLQWVTKHTGMTKKQVPQSYSSMKTMRKKLNLQKPIKYTLKSGSSFLYYSLKDHLVHIFGNQNHCEHMDFRCPDNVESMKEFTDTPMWKEACRNAKHEQLPVGIVLYYDKFGVFRSRNGSVGGLYFSLVNFDGNWRSHDENIFCLGLVPNDGLFLQVVALLIKELNELNKGFIVYHKGLQRCVVIKPTLEIFLADMPQRNQACCQKSHNASHPCHMCSITSDKLNFLMEDLDELDKMKRTRRLSMEMYKEMREGDREDRNAVKAFTSQHYLKNPFWALVNTFDIHQHTPPEIFHLEYVGILKKHFKLIWKLGLKAEKMTKKDIQKTMAKRVADFSSQGIVKEMTEDKFLSWADWTGDDWEAFLQISSWVFEGLVDPEQYKCWLLHVTYLLIMLRPSLCLKDIDEAEEYSKQFRRAFAELYKDKSNFPNNHQLTHLFDSARRFGPPILWWVQTYEMKHRSFKRSADKSNKKDLHIFCAAKEAVFQALLFGFQSKLQSFHTLKQTLYSNIEDEKKELKMIFSKQEFLPDDTFKEDLRESFNNYSYPLPSSMDVQLVQKMPYLSKCYITEGDMVMLDNKFVLKVLKGLKASDDTCWLEVEEMTVKKIRNQPFNGMTRYRLDSKRDFSVFSRFVPVDKVVRKVALAKHFGTVYLNHTVLKFQLEV